MSAAAEAPVSAVPAVAAAVNAVAANYKAAIFFDNDEDNIENVSLHCKHNLQNIKINELEKSIEIPFENRFFSAYIATLGVNHAQRFLQWIGHKKDKYDPLSGIQDKEIAACLAWETETNALAPRAALFDWDRTITIIEGIFPYWNEEHFEGYLKPYIEWASMTKEQMLESYLEYLCGGSARLAKLRELMNTLHAKGVTLYIVTNNDGCYESGYSSIVKAFFKDIPFKKVCSGKTHRGRKGEALKAEAGFSEICAAAGGRRRRSRSRRIRRRRSHRSRRHGRK
jgi:hypothetical protein